MERPDEHYHDDCGYDAGAEAPDGLEDELRAEQLRALRDAGWPEGVHIHG